MRNSSRSAGLGRPILVSIAIFGAIIITASAFYLYLQAITQENVRNSLFVQYKQNQIEGTYALGQHIEADLDRVVMRLEVLAREPALQRGDLASQEVSALLGKAEADITSQITPIDSLGLLDTKNVLANIAPDEYRNYIDTDRSETPYVKEINKTWQPYVSTTFVGAFGRQIIAIGVPVTNLETGERVGILVTAPFTTKFFERYGNTLNIDTQSIVAVDRDGTYLTAPRTEVVGKNFFSEEIQQLANHNQQVFRLYERSVKLGEANDALFDTGSGERFASAQPVFYRGQGQIMTVILSTPTDSIYSQVDTALAAQNLQSMILLAAMAAAIGAFVAFLLKWNSALESTVQTRTLELRESNEQLKDHDRLQQDFINVAAHELRTPIQPMLGIAEMMFSGLDGKDKIEVNREDVEMLERNANRLERLSSHLLEMARIEGKSMQLDLVQIDITTKIRNVIANAKSTLQKNIEIKYIEPDKPLAVRADKTKLFEVISNLLNNAIKFTQQGTVTISAQPSGDGSEIIIRVADTGSGIHPEILPRLFTKFATKSESGTGIGLYISKRIIEAHGGKIWAENNKNGIGATFTFTLPSTVA